MPANLAAPKITTHPDQALHPDVRAKGRGAISFFYYSGHGAANPDMQINYLIPVDVADPNDGNLWYQSLQQNDLINGWLLYCGE